MLAFIRNFFVCLIAAPVFAVMAFTFFVYCAFTGYDPGDLKL